MVKGAARCRHGTVHVGSMATGTEPTGSSVAGETTGKVPVPAGSTQSPPMKKRS